MIALLVFFIISAEGHAQVTGFEAPKPVNIPLQYYGDAYRLSILVGINGGKPKPYIFDTGSPVFNAAYNSAWWPDVGPSTSSLPGWNSTLPAGQNVQFCLGGSTKDFCRGYTGNLVQAPSLSFYDRILDNNSAPPVATLSTGTSPNQGYVINAVSYYEANSGPFDKPLLDNTFYGTFGAGNFTVNVPVVNNPPDRIPSTLSNYYAGGVLGQTIILGMMAQGYVVAANGQPNFVSFDNPPQQLSGINVTVGGKNNVPVTSCSPCVTVGLTPEILGQFWAAPPTVGGNSGVIPWIELGDGTFQNPYGGAVGNNASTERGTIYKTTLTPQGGDQPAIIETLPSLIDSGTPDLNLETNASPLQIDQISNSGSNCLKNGQCVVNGGVKLTVAGVDSKGQMIPGLQPTAMTLTKGTPYQTYNAFLHPNPSPNTIGISFFLQNSVMYDLTNQVTSYTPFFVTNTDLITTAGGPLIVNGENIWLGLAGVVSGPGGITIESKGQVQLSAANTYTGPTIIDQAGYLFISGPGSIEASSGVLNNGVFDISRAWSAVSIRNITGSGNIYLGGQNLIVTNADSVLSGNISDGGSYYGYPGAGGGLTLAGGNLTLSGVNTYMGPTNVQAGALMVNAGSNTGVGLTTIFSGAALGGTGAIGGSLVNYGLLHPGSSLGGGGIGALTVAGDLIFAPGSIYGVQIDSSGASDKTVVQGSTTINGGSVVVHSNLSPAQLLTTRIPILSSSQGVSGRFDSLNGLPPYSFLSPTLLYGGQDVSLGYGLTPFNVVGRTINQRNVGAALTVAAFGPLSPAGANVLNTLYYGSYQSAQGVMETIGGAGLAGVQTTAMEIGQMASSTISDQIGFWRSGAAGDTMNVTLHEHANDNARSFMAYAPIESGVTPKPAPAVRNGVDSLAAPSSSPRTFRVWGSMFGGGANFSADLSRGTAASTLNYYGGLIGVDYQLTPSALIGAALGGSNSGFNVGSLSTTGNLTGFHAGLYGAYTMGSSYVSLNETFSAYSNQTNRTAGGYMFLPYEKLSANFGSTEFRTRLEGGHSLLIGGLEATPFLAAEFAAYQSNAFTEESSLFWQSALMLRNSGQSIYSVPAFVGLRLSNSYTFGNGWRVIPVGSVAYVHEFSPNRQLTNMLMSIPGPDFNVAGPRSTYNLVQAKIGAQLNLTRQLALFTDFQGEFSSMSQSYGGKAGVRYSW